MPKFKPVYNLEYQFVIRRINEGPFKNLWRLDVKTPETGILTEMVDADMLSTVIAKIGYVFEQDGH